MVTVKDSINLISEIGWHFVDFKEKNCFVRNNVISW